MFDVTKSSADAKAHHGADDFLSQIGTLRQAEEAALASVESARQAAAQAEAAGREKAVEIAARASERAVEAKNEILSKGRAETDKECGAIIGEAKKQAEKIRSKRLPEKDAEALSQKLL